jgi:hypothetical protein
MQTKTRAEIEQLETGRWMRWLAFPMLIAAAFAGAAYATEIQWLFLPVLLGVLSYPMIIWMLALSSDTVAPALKASLESTPAESTAVPFEAAA